jgi:aryl-alcohol dehydrogenase-like predicted oxidoreductase
MGEVWKARDTRLNRIVAIKISAEQAATAVRKEEQPHRLGCHLKRLNTDAIDLFYRHRVDPDVPIEDVAGARVICPLSVSSPPKAGTVL